MDDETLRQRHDASLAAFPAAFARGIDGARIDERDGVVACVVPAVPERSIFNSVVPRPWAAVVPVLDDLTRLFDEAGVDAWAVWLDAREHETARALEAAGLSLDGTPQAMGLDLSALADAPAGLEVDRDPDPAAAEHVLRQAYGWDDAWARAFPARLPAGMHHYLARHGGEPAAYLAIRDHEGDALVVFVGTVPAARGRGLAGALLHAALADARERSCTTSTLQSSAMGRPVYRRLGYRDLGELQLWERRTR